MQIDPGDHRKGMVKDFVEIFGDRPYTAGQGVYQRRTCYSGY